MSASNDKGLLKTAQPIKAMILAAGRGNRLRPITDTTPKPLVPLLGKPLIEYHLEKLAKLGVAEVVINHAWLGDKIETQLGDGSRWGIKIFYSPEPEGGLETAGGIINALPMLGDEPFLVINGDVFTEYDFAKLLKVAETMQRENHQQNLAHLVMVPSPEHNSKGDFGIDAKGLIQEQGEYTFSGLSVLRPEMFAGMKADFIRLAPVLVKAIQAGQVSGELEMGLWSDIGTIERLEQTEDLLKANK